MTHDIIGMKDFQLRKWVSTYLDLKDKQGVRIAVQFVKDIVPTADQEMFGEYVRAQQQENNNNE